ncbi:hypothetical protein JW710_00330 [Candidatus Dojkabacteria bacterium]|nr:hypothetical protein [Candidatus Dojkabacteria bacterium]
MEALKLVVAVVPVPQVVPVAIRDFQPAVVVEIVVAIQMPIVLQIVGVDAATVMAVVITVVTIPRLVHRDVHVLPIVIQVKVLRILDPTVMQGVRAVPVQMVVEIVILTTVMTVIYRRPIMLRKIFSIYTTVLEV